ncbi:MAG: VTT domain-containing protein [Candidatus Hydrothermarchaeaceae archaeon]
MIIQSIVVPLPSSAIALSAGALCGIFLGSLYIWIGALIGASLCFFISKKYGKSLLKGKFSPGKTEKINNFMASYGFFAILVARLIPLISFDIVSYGAGLTTISFRRFFIATAIGIIPGTLFYTWLGLTILRFETLGLVLTLIMILAMVYYLKS